jgi:hypothetical protein
VVKAGQIFVLPQRSMVEANRAIRQVVQGLSLNSPPLNPLDLLAWEKKPMESNREHQSHKDREAQTLVERIEKKMETSQEASREAETKRTLDDYGKKVGS